MTHQLASYSPLSLTGLVRAVGGAGIAPRASEAELKALLALRYGVRDLALFGSGTQALEAARRLAAERSPGPVALPAYSCFDVLTAAVGAGARVLFYDVDPVSLVPDPEDVRAALRLGARTVVAGYLFGFPIDWPSIRAECRAAGAVLVEDAAQGLGAGWGDVQAGGHGDMSVLSFGRGKGWTGGCGGALLLHDRSLAEPLSAFLEALDGDRPGGLRTAAVVGAQWLLGRPTLYGIPSSLPGLRLGETVYKDPVPIADMPPVACAVAHRHASAAQREVHARRSGATEWDGVLGPRSELWRRASPCTPAPGGACGWLRYPVRLHTPGAADRVVRDTRRLGIARGYPATLPSLPQARGVSELEAVREWPGARSLAEGLITLPTHSLVRPGSRNVAATRLIAAVVDGAEDER